MTEDSDKRDEEISQRDLIMEFFQNNPKRDVAHPEVVDWVSEEFLKRTGRKFRDPDRGIRKLHQEGWLVKVGNGIYRYDPSLVTKRELEDFTNALKKEIFERDGYRCVMCGRGPKEGFKLYADHIKAKDLGGKATLENGQTLCGPHNFLKKNFKQTETGKKMFVRLYETAKAMGDDQLIKFCSEILSVYERNGMNGHVTWTK